MRWNPKNTWTLRLLRHLSRIKMSKYCIPFLYLETFPSMQDRHWSFRLDPLLSLYSLENVYLAVFVNCMHFFFQELFNCWNKRYFVLHQLSNIRENRIQGQCQLKKKINIWQIYRQMLSTLLLLQVPRNYTKSRR
jgi:hypothetical protein